MSIQILQYEFLGPIPIEEWGPPMEKLVYLILSRDKDKFNIVYVGDCEKTEDKSFFIQHSQHECWVKHSGSKKSLYLAILPLFESTSERRKIVFQKIIAHYKPLCNSMDIPKSTPDYLVRKSKELNPESEKITCLCCGAEMKFEKLLEKSTLFRCTGCGLSDTKMNC